MYYVVVYDKLGGGMAIGPIFGGPYSHAKALEIQASAAQILGGPDLRLYIQEK